jgi:enoyl-CoA hydratase/carnithine racemase
MGRQPCQTLTYQETGRCRRIDLVECPDESDSALQRAEFAEVCELVAWDEAARVVVLVFNGERDDPDGMTGRSSLVEQAARIKQPVIAAIRGNATGFGLELALTCDIRIAGSDASFGFPGIRDGRMPAHGGTQRLPRQIGLTRAVDMLLTGSLMKAAEALQAGLIHRLATAETIIETAVNLAAGMAEYSPLSLGYAKEAVHAGSDLPLDQGLRLEQDMYLIMFSTEDRVEGISAFKEKRKPGFKGR